MFVVTLSSICAVSIPLLFQCRRHHITTLLNNIQLSRGSSKAKKMILVLRMITKTLLTRIVLTITVIGTSETESEEEKEVEDENVVVSFSTTVVGSSSSSNTILPPAIAV